GRKYEELGGALGLYAKSVPIHCHFEDNLQFTDVLEQIIQSKHEASRLQEYFSWEKIETNNGNHSHTNMPFFGFDFARGGRSFAVAGLTFSIYKKQVLADYFNVKLSCIRNGNSLITSIYYDQNIVSLNEVERIIESYNRSLSKIAYHIESYIDHLDIIAEAERRQLIYEYNATARDYPAQSTVHQMFRQQAERTPEAVAVFSLQDQLNFAELDARSNQLAHYLRKFGVRPEVRVGLLIDRSIEMVVALLGVLKAGRAYVPLDPP